MKPATQAKACRASTSPLRPMTCSTAPREAGAVSPGRTTGVGSGVDHGGDDHDGRDQQRGDRGGTADPAAQHRATARRSSRRGSGRCRAARGRGRSRRRSLPGRSVGVIALRAAAGASSRAASARGPEAAPRGGRRVAAAAASGHPPHRLGRDPPGHLRLPVLALAEDDRDLDGRGSRRARRGRSARPGRRSRASARRSRSIASQHLGAEALEAAGEVAHVEAQHDAGVQAARRG